MAKKSKTHHNPDVEYNICSLWQRVLAGNLRVLVLVPNAYLVKRCADDHDTQEYVEIILRWTTTDGRLRFEAVDDVTNNDLNDVKDEDGESKTLDHGLGEYNENLSSFFFVIPCGCRRSEVRHR